MSSHHWPHEQQKTPVRTTTTPRQNACPDGYRPGKQMDAIAHPDERPVEAYRNYLRMLARIQVPPRLQAKLDASDIVQQAILQAHESRAQFRGITEAEK